MLSIGLVLTACDTIRQVKDDAVYHISTDAQTAKGQISSGQAAENIKQDARNIRK